MNKFVKQQLMKCTTKLPDWDDNTTEMIISNNHSHVEVATGSFYISIENYIINEPPNFTLSANWNGGTVPPESNMIVSILEKRGRMYKVSGKGAVTGKTWSGWLPEKGFSIND